MDEVEKILRENCPEYRAETAREQRARQNAEALRGVKGAAMTGGGIVMLLLFQIYSLLPLVGALSVVVGLVGFCTGAHFALRTFLIGLAVLAVKPIVGAVFLKMLNRKDECEEKRSRNNGKLILGCILSWVGSLLIVIGWVGVFGSILLLLDSPLHDGTWFVWLLFSVGKIGVGTLLRNVARRMGFAHSTHPVLGAVIGGLGILLSVLGWMGIVGVVFSLFSERSTFDPLNTGVIIVFLIVFGSVVRHRGDRISGKEITTHPQE